MLGGGRCDVEVVRPQSCTKCMQLLGEHYCITFQLHMQRKDESLNACHFSPPAKCTATVSQKFHSGGGCALEVVLVEFVDLACAACTASTL